jgi:hypothetical protein
VVYSVLLAGLRTSREPRRRSPAPRTWGHRSSWPRLPGGCRGDQVGTYQKGLSKDRPLQTVDLYLIHALGVTGANRFIEAVTKRPSAPCKAVVGDVAWKRSGLFRDLPHGAYTSVSAAHDAISVRFEQRRSYYANLLEVYGVTDSHLEAGGN